jgi:hypothetical protein
MTTENYPDILFARTEGNRIIEFPVTLEEIQNRGAPLTMFRQVVFGEKPAELPFHRIEEKLEVENLTPYVRYVNVPMTIQEILNALWLHKEEIKVNEVPQELFQRVVQLARVEIAARLDAFAQTRDYDNIVSLCSYATDPLPVHAAEGQRAVNLRSGCWEEIRRYSEAVATGKQPVPRLETEIFAGLPALTWED